MSKHRTDKIRPVSDDSALEDTEAHRIYNTSDRTAKHDVADVAWEDDDSEAHGFRMGATTEDADSEGHAFRHGAVPEDEDTEGHGRFNV